MADNKKQQYTEDDFEDILGDEIGQEEVQSLNDERPAPQRPQMKARPPMVNKQTPSIQDEEEPESYDDGEDEENQPPTPVPVIQPKKAKPSAPRPVQKPKEAEKRFVAVYQPERSALAYADTGEVLFEGAPLWAHQMWADLKNDIDEIKERLGKL